MSHDRNMTDKSKRNEGRKKLVINDQNVIIMFQEVIVAYLIEGPTIEK